MNSEELQVLHNNLTEAVGISLFNYERCIKGFPTIIDADEMKKGWTDMYNVHLDLTSPLEYPMFRNAVRGLVSVIMHEVIKIDDNEFKLSHGKKNEPCYIYEVKIDKKKESNYG